MKTIALYCGSFNPFHIGHLNIVQKAEAVFGRGNVWVMKGINPAKDNGLALWQTEKLCVEMEEIIGSPFRYYTSFTHELIEKFEKEGHNVILIRGLRNGDDLAYEDNQMRYMKDFKSDIKSVLIKCDEEYEHISSSAIRQLESFKAGSGSRYIVS